jgi:MFS family permease
LVGGYVGDVDIAYPWLVGVAGFTTTAAVAMVTMRRDTPPALRDDSSTSSVSSRLNPLPAIRSQIAGGLVTVARHPTLRFLCLLTGLLSFAYMPTLQLWPTQMTRLSGEGAWLMGWVWATLNLAAVLGSWALPRLLARADRPRVALALTMLRTVSLATAALAGGFGKALVGLIGQSVGTGASDPLLGAWMNEHAASHQRATVLSVQAMSFMLGGSAGLLVLGLAARSGGVPAAWLGGSLALLAGALLIVRRGRRDAVAAAPAGDLV